MIGSFKKLLHLHEDMLQEKLGLNDKDVIILNTFMKNPEVSQSELAKVLKLSQPSVNARIQKLKQQGLLSDQYGIDTNKADMSLARVDCTASNAKELLDHLNQCSFFVNGFTLSGVHNVSIFMVAHSLKKIESIVDKHLRCNPNVKNIEMSVVVSATNPFICQIDLEKEQHESCQNPGSCDTCRLSKLN